MLHFPPNYFFAEKNRDRDKVWAKLARAAQGVARNAEQLTGYVLKPLWLVTSPESPLAARLQDEVEMNLDFEIEQQGEDGAWSPEFLLGRSISRGMANSEKRVAIQDHGGYPENVERFRSH